jgi:peptidoglycan hydrolase CwlO-like protein
VDDYRESSRQQVEQLQTSLEERNNEISILKSQMEVLEGSNDSLGELLRRANSRIIELTRELSERNRFIKEYIEQAENGDL